MQNLNRCLLAALCALASLAHALPTDQEQVVVVSVRARRQAGADDTYESSFDTTSGVSPYDSTSGGSSSSNYPAGGASRVAAAIVGGSGGAAAGGKPRVVTAMKKPGVISAEGAFKKAAEAAAAKRGPIGRTSSADANSAGTVSKDLQTLNGLDEYEKAEPKAILKEGDVLSRNDSLTNSCGYRFVNQEDGNLVLYHGNVAAPSWASNTAGVGGTKDMGNWTAKMEKGALAMYSPTSSRGRSRRPPIWTTKTQGEGNKGVLTRDGNFVIVDSQGKILFNTVSFSKIPCVGARAKPVVQSPPAAANPVTAPAPVPAPAPDAAPAPAPLGETDGTTTGGTKNPLTFGAFDVPEGL